MASSPRTDEPPGLRRTEALPPGLTLLRGYQRSWFRDDLIAGLVLTALLVPQGIAYAQLAGLPPVAGLYATFVPLLVYALLGPSRILVLGPDSALAPIVAAAVVPLAGDSASERVALAGLLAIMVGVILLVASLARLGFLTDLLSKPVTLGYLAGIALIVVVNELPHALGYAVSGDDLLDEVVNLIEGVPDADFTTAVIGAASLAVILAARRITPALPGALLAIVGSTLLVEAFGLSVEVVGPVPAGLPSPTLPSPSIDDYGRLALSSLAIALVSFADTSVLSRSYSSRLGEWVDQSAELRALGLANLVTGLFQGFPISSSSSRTPVAEAAGAKTQLTGVVAALGLCVLLVAGTGLLRDIPRAAVAAVLIAAVLRLVDVAAVVRLFKVNRADFALALSSFIGVAVFGILAGIGIAVGLSVLAVMERAWHPYMAVLGRVAGLKGYHDITRHPEAAQIPGLLLFRFDAPLFFANAEVFHEALLKAMASLDRPLRVVVAAEPITDIDSTAADMLVQLGRDLRKKGITLAFAEMKGPVKDSLRRYGIFDLVGEDRFYPTIGESVHSHVAEHGIDWRDWEDEEQAEHRVE